VVRLAMMQQQRLQAMMQQQRLQAPPMGYQHWK
jgi:hypothetical protein